MIKTILNQNKINTLFYTISSNIILNQCISLCHNMPFTMHNREITHIVKADSLSKTQLIVRTKCSFCCHLRRSIVNTKQSSVNNTMQKLDLRL